MARKPSGVRFLDGDKLAELIGIPPMVPSIPGSYCSFCGKDLEGSKTIHGQGQLRATLEHEPIRDSFGKVIDSKEVLKWSSSKLKSCENCSLNLAERYVRDKKGGFKLNAQGERIVIGNKVKWFEFD